MDELHPTGGRSCNPSDTPADTPPLVISGKFTIFTAAELKQKLLDAIKHAEADELDIDLSEVSEIDSAGLQLMVMAKREATAVGKTLRFTRHSDAVLGLIDLCDLSGFFGDPMLIRSNS